MQTTILAIETSCDETGVAVLVREGDNVTTLAQAVASQIDVHALTGGVVPDVAAREHTKVLVPMIERVVGEAGIAMQEVNAIAATVGPGLMPALVVGVAAARTLAFKLDVPIVPVHHLEGHIYSALLGGQNGSIPANNVFPALALLVSGGHTMLVAIDALGHYRVLGTTRDDAAGEAFDKVARLLELPYPGGPQVSKLAEKGNKEAIAFPRPMLHSGDLDVSFSGLKTAVLYELRDNKEAQKEDIAASFQEAVVDTLAQKTQQALKVEQYNTLLLSGGVAANTALRERIGQVAETVGVRLHIAPLELCGDNAVMIGQAALLTYPLGRKKTWQEVDARARIPLEEYSL